MDEQATGTRGQQLLAFIVDYITRTGNSPSFKDMQIGLAIGPTRTKELLKELVRKGDVQRPVGGHRAISVPGLSEKLVIARLRAQGVIVDEDFLSMPPRPQGHLPLVAIVGHDPAILAGGHHVESAGGDV